MSQILVICPVCRIRVRVGKTGKMFKHHMRNDSSIHCVGSKMSFVDAERYMWNKQMPAKHSVRICETPGSGDAAIALFRAVSKLARPHDVVKLTEVKRDGILQQWREIEFVPYDNRRLTVKMMIALYELGDRYGCRLTFKADNGRVVCNLSDGGRDFQGNNTEL